MKHFLMNLKLGKSSSRSWQSLQRRNLNFGTFGEHHDEHDTELSHVQHKQNQQHFPHREFEPIIMIQKKVSVWFNYGLKGFIMDRHNPSISNSRLPDQNMSRAIEQFYALFSFDPN